VARPRHISQLRNYDRKADEGTSDAGIYNNIYFYTLVANVSYVTGSHAFKTGMSDMVGCPCGRTIETLPTLRFNNGCRSRFNYRRCHESAAPDSITTWVCSLRINGRSSASPSIWVCASMRQRASRCSGCAGGNLRPRRHFDPIYDVPN
jgi:hypothetical protein